MSEKLLEKHKLVTEFALMVYQSDKSAHELKIKYRFVPEEEKPEILIQSVLQKAPPIIQQIYSEQDRDEVLELCNTAGQLCEDPKWDVVWKWKITKECRSRFRGGNLWKYSTIVDFNRDHQSNFRNFYHIFQLCKLIPSKKEELIEHVFAIKDPKPDNKFNFVQIISFTPKGLIVRRIPSMVMKVPGSKSIIRPKMDWVVQHPIPEHILKMRALPRDLHERFPDYTHVLIDGQIESKINKHGFREWWFVGRGKGTYKLIIDYY